MNSVCAALCVFGTDDRDPPIPLHGFVRGDVERVPHLVGHDQRGDVLQIAQLDDLVVHRRRDDGIEAGGRVVEQQECRPGGHGAGDADPAPLTTRQRCRHRVDQRSKPDEGQHLLDPRANGRPGHGGLLVQPVAHVLVNGQGIEECVFLEQHADVGAHTQQIALGHRVDALAADDNGAGIRTKQAKDQLEHDGFPRAAVAKQDPHASAGNLEAHVAQHHLLIERERDPVEDHGRAGLRLAGNGALARQIRRTIRRCGRRLRRRQVWTRCPDQETETHETMLSGHWPLPR